MYAFLTKEKEIIYDISHGSKFYMIDKAAP